MNIKLLVTIRNASLARVVVKNADSVKVVGHLCEKAKPSPNLAKAVSGHNIEKKGSVSGVVEHLCGYPKHSARVDGYLEPAGCHVDIPEIKNTPGVIEHLCGYPKHSRRLDGYID